LQDDNGKERINEFEMEKQTNAERLKRVDWDEEKAWNMIK
jgi:hypothetical protein